MFLSSWATLRSNFIDAALPQHLSQSLIILYASLCDGLLSSNGKNNPYFLFILVPPSSFWFNIIRRRNNAVNLPNLFLTPIQFKKGFTSGCHIVYTSPLNLYFRTKGIMFQI